MDAISRRSDDRDSAGGNAGRSGERRVWLSEYDGYYYDPRGTPVAARAARRYDDPYRTWIYLDPARGGIVQRSVSITRLRRWLYQGLHLDLPSSKFSNRL